MGIIDSLRKRSPFGKKVIGAEAAKYNREELRTNRRKFGPLVRGSSPTLPGSQQLDPNTTPVVAGILPIGALKKVLTENPHLLNSYVEKEGTRLPHPRVQALEFMAEIAKTAKNNKAAAAIKVQLAAAKKVAGQIAAARTATETVKKERNAAARGPAKKKAAEKVEGDPPAGE